MGEKEIRLQLLGDPFVFGKFHVIIRSEGMQTIRNGLKQFDHRIIYHRCHSVYAASFGSADDDTERLPLV